jgi:5-methylcytosine-specific restriction endonuclease McrA
VLNASKRPYSGPNKRQKYECLCAKCGNHYPLKEAAVDHITPVGTLKSFDDLPGFVERLFCGVEGLQVLCETCHNEKTQEERRTRNADAAGVEDEVD